MAYVTRSMELPAHAVNDPQPLDKKAPYKRRITDKRRDQNRAAQKTYRAKRKERLEFLERQVTALQDLNPTSDQDACMPGTSSAVVASDTALSVLSEKESSSSGASTLSSSQDPALVQLRNLLDIDDQEDVDGLLQFALKEKPDLSKILLAGLQALKSARERVSSCHESNQVDFLQPQARPNSSPKTPLVFLNDLPLLPDLLAGGIFLRHQPIMDVFHHNCQKIGLQLGEMARSCQSPWYSPFSSLPSSLVPLDTVPPDLYPTPAQQRFPHHPFIDIIPFPWLRERAIILDSLDPPPYNRFELKSDILSNGMICWKSRAGSEGLPWDRRSWEVQPWFWNKWSWLIEDQGKVEQQSRWWRALRE